MKNIDKYKNDLKLLTAKGDELVVSMKYHCYPENIKKQIKSAFGDEEKVEEFIKNIIPFNKEYQS
ncbi:hypothetical protein [Hymenobacter bucti]|uniref:Uncharacterized protein n=1 Tax=Hymenobacter bucti TaxID=1844114 RepID=A0ABW4QZU1_9BACT